MARSSLKPLMIEISFFMVLVIASSLSEARPLTAPPRSSTSEGIEFLFEGLYIEGIKTGGPSSGGGGHNFPNAVQTLGGIKNSGPSSGGGGH
ncbi:hypothetical protein L484_006800 [Morus notabilis]|uniref:Uncharacterized protein n=1 Tax=Morus notabilis TaxID=981085 RepID=W9RRL9_9ROSA|nr:hypothetical protein L484_006800 [Morus notabilis]